MNTGHISKQDNLPLQGHWGKTDAAVVVVVVVVECCFTSTETIRLIRDGSPRTATSIFTQFLR